MKIDPQMTLLVVEDSPTLVVAYQEYLRDEPCDVTYVETGADALAHIQKKVPDVILLDLGLPDMNGMEILKYINEHQLPCLVVVVTAQGSIDIAVEALRNYKAFDFIEKPFDGQRLLITIRNALRLQQLTKAVNNYKKEVESYKKFKRPQYYDLVGASSPMQVVYQIIENAASSKATVFVTGESGTGKELCAEAIHKQSPRRNKPFFALNCAAIPKDLIESEIFGHVKGAFTGAVSERAGAAFQAHFGTLFLDEIGEMNLDLQSKLLRFVQTGIVKKVGGSKQEKVDVRFICATNRDPLIEVQEGRFREDLYYRLHVIPIVLPPLRERGDDILLIAKKFLTKYAKEENRSFRGFAPETETILRHYEWPGNVRELQNVIRNIVVLNDGQEVTAEMLPAPLNKLHKGHSRSKKASYQTTHAQTPAVVSPPSGLDTAAARRSKTILPLWQIEKETILHAIELCDGNVPKAAALLEVSPSTIYRKRQNWE
ncbi:MAG: sigma-54-dependent Fis family transcriptional regulator [Candidatus Parabeggiatoa sp. nov. 2]|nr:MAG: sigma-54-dependent Fis family transcriptional regulator [Beggiatoa sp. 4572_84]